MELNFRLWLERTLYHGTVIDNLGSIKKLGLFGSDADDKNSFVYQAYANGFDSDKQWRQYARDKEVPVFMTDKDQLNKAINAMHHHIGTKLGKYFHGVTDNDVRNHGLLVIVKDTENSVTKAGNDDTWRDDYIGIEPEDYYSSGERADGFLYGNKLIRFLNKMGYETIPDEKYKQKLAGWQKSKDYASYKKYPLFANI